MMWMATLCCCNCDHKDEYIEEMEAELEEYQQIGTPEECRAAVEIDDNITVGNKDNGTEGATL